MTTLQRVLRAPVAVVLSAFMLSVSILVGSFVVASGNSHDDTYYACLYAGSLTQVNTSGPPANCGRGTQVQWSSFGGVISASQLSDEVLQDIKCGAFPHLGVDWSGCNLHFAILTGAVLVNANLAGANLHGADLAGANLNNSNLAGADLSAADLTGAVLAFADLTGADLTDTILTGIIWGNTICPDGTNSNNNGNTCVNNL